MEHLPRLNNKPVVETLRIKDEFDAEEFAAIFSEHDRLVILADIPGAGKTHSLLKYCQPFGNKALFVTPYNALADDLVKCKCELLDECKCVKAKTAITFNRLLGLLAHGEDPDEEPEHKSIRAYDVSAITHIVFDEIFCYKPQMLSQLKRFMAKHEGKIKFYAAGDPHQNAPIIGTCLSRLELKEFYIRTVGTLFPKQIRLSICKRVSSAHERERMTEIKDAVLHSDTDLLDICRKYFKPITSVEQLGEGRAVCYTNESARVVNRIRQEAEASELEKQGVKIHRFPALNRLYYMGQSLRCRAYNKAPRLYVNYTYMVSGFEEKGGVITGIYLNHNPFPWALSLIRKHFNYDFANTCHSLQGMSASDGVCLFDVEGWYITREWFYTALTRTRDLNKVYFWDAFQAGTTVSGLPAATDADFVELMVERIADHKKEDKKKGFDWEEEEYVDGERILELFHEQNKQCAHCGENLLARWKKGDKNATTIDRIDNDFAHVKDNVMLTHCRCNAARH